MGAAFAIRTYISSGRDDLEDENLEELRISILEYRVCQEEEVPENLTHIFAWAGRGGLCRA